MLTPFCFTLCLIQLESENKWYKFLIMSKVLQYPWLQKCEIAELISVRCFCLRWSGHVIMLCLRWSGHVIMLCYSFHRIVKCNGHFVSELKFGLNSVVITQCVRLANVFGFFAVRFWWTAELCSLYLQQRLFDWKARTAPCSCGIFSDRSVLSVDNA